MDITASAKNAPDNPIVETSEWRNARLKLLQLEKEETHLRDRVRAARQALPWVKVDKDYAFETLAGRKTFAELFDGRSQLLVYHFMLGPDWDEGCIGCSFFCDHVEGALPHLNNHDVTWVAVSRAPLDKIEAYRKRMGWSLRWVSSLNNDFNFDYGVSFPPDEKGPKYNLETQAPYGQEAPGLSAFRRGEDGAIYRTYSTYARGLDVLNGAYHLLDMTSKGRDEKELSFSMAWVRRHDRY